MPVTRGFCTWFVGRLAQHPSSVSWGFIPFQNLSDRELEQLGMSRSACRLAVHVVDENSRVLRGALAINAVLERRRAMRVLIRIARAIRPLLDLEMRAYAFVASNRVAISRLLGSARCAMYEE
ncbi:MAG: DCC1-like thiol-disulfide oxidoreductase family protein [Candidatus Velthaea sp.]|jgi:predicted DCC family thiol-disulfide oxidoreductase YuxK